jgi:hypothetical protein
MGPEGASVSRDALAMAERLAETYDRTSEVVEHSAALAARIAERQRRYGRNADAEDEYRAAEWARQSALRARSLAAKQRTLASALTSIGPGAVGAPARVSSVGSDARTD